MYFRKGDEVRVRDAPEIPEELRGLTGIVRGHRPGDGLTVVEFGNRIRRPLRTDDLEPLATTGAQGDFRSAGGATP